MSFKAKINSAVNTAFASVGDLVILATLSSRKVTAYNFSSRGVVSTTSTKEVEVIIQSTQKPSGEGFTTTALMKSGPDLSVYDTLKVNNLVYHIVDYTDDNFVITAIIVREK